MEGIGSWFYFLYCLWAPEDFYLIPLRSKDLLPILPWQDEIPGWFCLPFIYLAHTLAAEQMPYSSHVWLLLPYWKMKSVACRLPPTPTVSITITNTIGSLDLGLETVHVSFINTSTVPIGCYYLCSTVWGFYLVLWLHGGFKWSFPRPFHKH